MSPQLAAVPRLSADAHLAQEENAAQKHESIRGEVFARADVTDAQITTSLNFASVFKAHLRGSPCRAFIADMKLRVQATYALLYPDAGEDVADFASIGLRLQLAELFEVVQHAPVVG